MTTQSAQHPTIRQGHERADCAIGRVMLEEFERELATTRRFLERLPEGSIAWRPHPKSMTAGQLALHLAEIPERVLAMALADEVTPPEFRERQQAKSVREILELLDRGAAYVRKTLPTIDDERMRATIRFIRGGRELMALPRGVFLRNVLLNHWYQHRGQFGVYLRMIGAAVPWSYGPSGDESPF